MKGEIPHPPDKPELDRRARPPVPRIYVASLADYNAGRLHGSWVDAAQDAEDINTEISRMLGESPTPNAEEWAIHDYEGFAPVAIGEYDSVETVAAVAAGLTEHGPAFAAWADHIGLADRDELRRFEDHYLGHWPSAADYAADMLADMGVDLDALGPEGLAPYVRFDLEGYARDLSIDALHISDSPDGGVFIFDRL